MEPLTTRCSPHLPPFIMSSWQSQGKKPEAAASALAGQKRSAAAAAGPPTPRPDDDIVERSTAAAAFAGPAATPRIALPASAALRSHSTSHMPKRESAAAPPTATPAGRVLIPVPLVSSVKSPLLNAGARIPYSLVPAYADRSLPHKRPKLGGAGVVAPSPPERRPISLCAHSISQKRAEPHPSGLARSRLRPRSSLWTRSCSLWP